jgi:hypothetical protein
MPPCASRARPHEPRWDRDVPALSSLSGATLAGQRDERPDCERCQSEDEGERRDQEPARLTGVKASLSPSFLLVTLRHVVPVLPQHRDGDGVLVGGRTSGGRRDRGRPVRRLTMPGRIFSRRVSPSMWNGKQPRGAIDWTGRYGGVP